MNFLTPLKSQDLAFLVASVQPQRLSCSSVASLYTQPEQEEAEELEEKEPLEKILLEEEEEEEEAVKTSEDAETRRPENHPRTRNGYPWRYPKRHGSVVRTSLDGTENRRSNQSTKQTAVMSSQEENQHRL
ncbi:hypothetical protein Pint_04657 [Pistacia integerrima]|uniref:Uncharacterized protein n=1 Tax=Pistacia integerrima TaxID=434235 RepID=A0ACC0Z958_9ROSI|nr:hypothetical protein Pint_04657 [Pistacia integerrima]